MSCNPLFLWAADYGKADSDPPSPSKRPMRRFAIWSLVANVFALHIPEILFQWRRIGIRLSIGFAGSNGGHFCGNFQFSWNFCNFAVEFLKIDCICIML